MFGDYSDDINNPHEFITDEKNSDIRLDMFLTKIYKDFSRSKIKNLIDSKNVLVNNISVKSGYKLKQGDIVSVEIPDVEPISVAPENIDIDIVYQDNELAVINKKQGMVVHPALGNSSGTLVNALLFHLDNLSGINGKIRPGIVHRLDKNTSGLLVIAKNDIAHNKLSEQIQNKTCKRIYRAIVLNAPKDDCGVFISYLTRSEKDRKKYSVNFDEKGKKAITHYKVLERFENYTFMEFELETGRTHQIRVHASYLGIPILGDDVYGASKNKFGLNGQCLHAYKLCFYHPTTKDFMSFEAPLPDYFEKVLKNLRAKNH